MPKHVIVTEEDDLAAGVHAITNGRSADIVFEPVGGPMFEQLAGIVAEEGLIVEYGWLQEWTPVPVGACHRQRIRVQGFHLGFTWRTNRSGSGLL